MIHGVCGWCGASSNIKFTRAAVASDMCGRYYRVAEFWANLIFFLMYPTSLYMPAFSMFHTPSGGENHHRYEAIVMDLDNSKSTTGYWTARILPVTLSGRLFYLELSHMS